MTHLVDVEKLTVRFARHSKPAVTNVSFTLDRGESLALIGESGSGKSVTLRSLVGLVGAGAESAAERLRFGGEDIRAFSGATWRRVRGGRIGFILQDALGSLDPLRPVGREIDEALRLHRDLSRAGRHERVIELLQSVGVPEPELRARQYPHQLSGGLRQRALIASAIACGPELLLADEPTTALDALVQAQVLDLLQAFRTPKTGLLIVSHDLAVAARLADRIAVMWNGEIVEQGPSEAVLGDPRHPYTKKLLAASSSVHARAPVASRPASAGGEKPVIEARGLTKSFVGVDHKQRTVVSDVSFSLLSGETLGVVGESGSGKTTLTRIILGLDQQDAGEVLLRGRDWRNFTTREKQTERRRVQVVFQDPLSSFDPRYTVEKVISEALAVAGYSAGKERRSRAVELLELVRLDACLLTRRPIELSGGQRQRVAIARALAPNPEVIICDEPVSALDVSVQAQILDLLTDLKARLGIAYLFISHDLGIIQRMSDHVLVMKDGRVVESGDVVSVFRHPRHDYTRALLDAIPALVATHDAPARAALDEPTASELEGRAARVYRVGNKAMEECELQ
ncbi:ABC transporter ATP-binding protein [Methylosinus sp. H3A]|uniref:dipeptide ABC transporter ATP-binding protein n=1 Tax=Methylosinus sp. H3A TaxID=2785786 RepID=UPI0018C21415|nr:ABC transporter ATP-binding protein [Methylosinus sp. H3A]MBG0808288.1 ABC transporter ATP-binding protein [Methylosinus sp. H3A]